MERIASGDARAFEELLGTRLSGVTAVARRMLGRDADAEDVAQEAFLRLWRHAGKWEPGRAKVSTWLYRVATNLCVDRLRSGTREVVSDPPEMSGPGDQEGTLQQQDLSRSMDEALKRLPERQRTALVLFHYEDMSMAEVAGIMEVSVEAVESLLGRGRRALKQDLKPQWQTLMPDAE